MTRRPLIAALATVLLAGCRADEPGAGLYYRTRALTDAQADSLELAIAAAPFRIMRVSGVHMPGGPSRGEVRLVRGADTSAELDRLGSWLRRQPGIEAVGGDSAHVFR